MSIDDIILGIWSRARLAEACLFYFVVALSSKRSSGASFVEEEVCVCILNAVKISHVDRWKCRNNIAYHSISGACFGHVRIIEMIPLLRHMIACISSIMAAPKTAKVLIDSIKVIYQRLVQIAHA